MTTAIYLLDYSSSVPLHHRLPPISTDAVSASRATNVSSGFCLGLRYFYVLCQDIILDQIVHNVMVLTRAFDVCVL